MTNNNKIPCYKCLTHSFFKLLNSCRGKIKTKVALTNQSPLFLDVTSQTQSVFFYFGRKMMQQLEEKFWLCGLKASSVGTRKTLVSGRTPRHWRSIVSQCPPRSHGPGPVRRAQHAAFLLPQPVCAAVPQSKNKTHSHPDILSSDSFPTSWLPVQTETDLNSFRMFIDAQSQCIVA